MTKIIPKIHPIVVVRAAKKITPTKKTKNISFKPIL